MTIPSRNYQGRDVNPERLAAARRHAGRRVLDVGCGNGCYVRALQGHHEAVGLDIDRFDDWKGEVCFIQGGANPLPFPDNSFDTILCFDALEHISNPEAVIREFHRVARKNVILTVPNCDVSEGMEVSRLTYFHYIDPTHCNFFDLDTLSLLVESVGLNVVERRLINPMSLIPLFNEACKLSGVWGLLVRAVLKRLIRREYSLTCLVVGEKTTGRST